MSGAEEVPVPQPDGPADRHPELALDPDVPGPPERPLHAQPRVLLAVLVGGALGAPARYALSLALPTTSGQWPWATLLANLLGAVLLGALLEGLARSGPDRGTRRLVRMALGTGVLGAFTTYSTLAVEVDLLVHAHRPALAGLYAAVSVLGGVLLSAAGIAVATPRTTERVPA